MMKRKFIFYAGFFLILVIGFYVAMTYAIPGYSEAKLPVLNHVQPFAFTDQEGQKVTNEDLIGKVYVAEYFFTTCQSICPIMNTNMRQVYADLRNEPDFLILSFTCDPGTDSVPRMKAYADSLGANPKKWIFLTGRKDSLYKTARVSFLLDDPKNNEANIDEQFLHTQFWALVDKNGQVRKIYDGLKKDEIEELKKDVPALLKEPATRKHFSNNLFGNSPT